MADNFDNYGMKVQATASVKMPTASEIDKQIRNLEKSISKLQISGKLDDSSLKNLSHQLDTLKATVTTANFSPTALSELTNQVNRALQNINIGNINVGNAGNQAQQVGQQIGNNIGQQITQSISSAIQKGTMTMKNADGTTKDLSKYIPSGKLLQNDVAKQALKDFQSLGQGIVTVKEEMKNIDGKNLLNGFTINIKNAKGEVESLRYALKNIEGKTGKSFQYVGGSINDAGAVKQFEQLSKVITNYQTKLDDLKTKYSNANVNYSGFEKVFNDFKQGIGTVNDLKLAFNQLQNSAKLGVQSLKSQSSSFDPIQQTLNNMRDLPSRLQALQADMGGLKDKTAMADISIKDLTSEYQKLQSVMTNSGGKVPLADNWTKSYRNLMSTLTSAENQVKALKKAEASDNSQITKQANYYSTILSNYRQIYSLKQKLLTAGKEETNVIKEQIRSLSASNASINKQLGAQGLKSKDWESELSGLKEQLRYSYMISEAKQKDIADTKKQSDAQKQSTQMTKELATAYQKLGNLKVQKSSLDTSKDAEKIAQLTQEIQKASQEYNNLYNTFRKRKNFDSSSWKETKSAIDSATKSQIEYNNAKAKDVFNSAKNNEISNLATLKTKWQEQGVLVGEFKTKIEQLENSLVNVGSKGELDNLNSQMENLKIEANAISKAFKQMEASKQNALAFTKSASERLSSAISKYSYGDTSDANTMMKQLNRGLSNFGDLSNIQGNITQLSSTVDKIIADLKLSHEQSLQALNQEIKAEQTLQSQKDAFNKRNLNAIDYEIQKREQEAKTFSSMLQAQMQEQQKMQAKVNKIQLSMSTGGYESKVDSLIGKTQQWVDANGNARISTDALQTAMNNLNTAYANITATGGNTVANQKALIEAERALDTEVKKVQSSVTSMNATMAKSNTVDSLRQKVQMFYDTNTKSHRTYGAQLRTIMSELATGAEVPITKLRQLSQEFIGIQNSARQAGKLGLSFFDTVKQGMKSFSYWTSSTFLVMKAIQEVRQVITNVKELDNAMMDLTMATGYNKNQVEELMDTYFKLGEELSATATDVAASADTWLRQGKSIAETNELIKDSMILSKISGLSAEESTKYLTSAMKGYKVATEDVLGVVDKLSAVDMASATDVGGLAEGMSEVAASADLAGVSMDKLLGYLAIVGETTQSGMSEVGTSFNAIFARMGNIKLARLKDYQNNGEDLSNVETVLRGEGIVLRDSVNEFRNFGEVLDEVAGRWTSFSEVSQRAIASAFAG